MEEDRKLAEKIAYEVMRLGGQTYYVGGCVRDGLLGIESKDIDIEIHGIERDALEKILDSVGERMEFGKSFGVYGIKGYGLDIALPRSERRTGSGHRDFDVTADPFIGTFRAAERRDFTVNAIMRDVISGQLTDYFGGQRDLENKVLRHVSAKTFAEDPLRVLRAAQFSARFGFDVDPGTAELCRGISLRDLSRERVFSETEKALLKSSRPSVFFEFLRNVGHLSVWFTELERTAGVPQDVRYHPEGDVWTHTMQVLDRCVEYRNATRYPLGFMMSAVCHDFGKSLCTEITYTGIHSYGHETAGLPLAETFIRRLTDERALRDYVLDLVEHHMKPGILAISNAPVKSSNRMFDGVSDPDALVFLSLSDGEYDGKKAAYLLERLAVYREYMSRTYVTGQDLIQAGLDPSEHFSEYLKYAHKLRLAGISREKALKQVLGVAKKQKK
ncbi:MAG: tRNA nucleotidyltransferase [Clostridia bacterium]|nr:tRNA nucleotidyltransferase [Clostridia bacterium]